MLPAWPIWPPCSGSHDRLRDTDMTDARSLLTLDDLDPGNLEGVRVLVRVDFNVPLEDGRVADTARLEAALPTLSELSLAGAALLLASHCGRPKGEPKPEFSLRPVAAALGELLDTDVRFASDSIGDAARAASESLAPGDICLLENLRYHNAETTNEPEFAAALASLADVYVSDAFGTVHRAHASVSGVPSILQRKAAGRLVVREVEALGGLLGSPEPPFVAVLGGAKISGKMDTLQNLLPRVDSLLVGGGMANTFLAAQGFDLADSLVEADRVEMARAILDRAEDEEVLLVLPTDLIITRDLDAGAAGEAVAADAVPQATKAVDIGPATCDEMSRLLGEAGTIFWNGPMGVFERPPFDAGTVAVANAVAASPGFSVIGGGETVAATRRAHAEDDIDHVSTGGGASLELLAGKTLPGLVALQRGDE
jgi:phosphoglycerate kinase